MVGHRPSLVCVLSLLFVTATASGARAQIGGTSSATRVQSGDTVQPAFEGWQQNPDGTYTLWFGYFNRNWAEELNVPVGPNNNIQPGGPDQGQPEFFQTGEQKRRQMFAFKIVVPADWPKDRDLIWTLTTHGTTLKAYGSLWPVWMMDGDVISANRGAQRDTDPIDKNSPPTIIDAPKDQTISVGTPLPLTMKVTDDGLPKPLARRSGRGTGLDDLKRQLRVTWMQWRGPGVVKFDPEAVAFTNAATGQYSATGGTAATKATFDKPGTYVLKAYAEDMSLFSMHTLTVMVTGAAAAKD